MLSRRVKAADPHPPPGAARASGGIESDPLQGDDLRRLEALVRLLDEAFAIPGTKWRVGLDSLLGLVPGAGDLVTALLSGYILKEAARLGVSRVTLARMLGNVAVDFAVGAVPLLGDLFDVAFKANRRNMKLLRKHLARAEREEARSS